MSLNALAPWFGGKRTLAPRIVEALGPHSAYWEPFCGGFSVISAKPRSRQECLNDLHGDIINLARVVQDDALSPQLFRRLVLTIPHEEELAAARSRVVDRPGLRPDEAPDLERAAAFFILSWLGRNGESGLKKNDRASRVCVRWSANGGDPGTRFRNAVDGIPSWWERLRGVTILQRDAFEILERVADDRGTAIYCDPPYLVKSDRYQHDFTDHQEGIFADDHARLASALARFERARVVVSYYEHPRLLELYPPGRWSRKTIDLPKNLSHQGAGPARAVEVLLVSRGADSRGRAHEPDTTAADAAQEKHE